MSDPYPINLNLTDKPVVVIGGGRVAARKIRSLLAAGAKVTVISPTLSAQIKPRSVTWLQRPYRSGDIAKFGLIIACTSDEAVNHQIVMEANAFQWVNNTSDKAQSDFFNVAKIENHQYLITVSSKGRFPKMTKLIKRQLMAWLRQQKWFREES